MRINTPLLLPPSLRVNSYKIIITKTVLTCKSIVSMESSSHMYSLELVDINESNHNLWARFWKLIQQNISFRFSFFFAAIDMDYAVLTTTSSASASSSIYSSFRFQICCIFASSGDIFDITINWRWYISLLKFCYTFSWMNGHGSVSKKVLTHRRSLFRIYAMLLALATSSNRHQQWRSNEIDFLWSVVVVRLSVRQCLYYTR